MGKVIIFSAPSGSGKTTIVRHLLERYPQLEFSISATSRAPRGQERDGVDYYFLSQEEFMKAVAENRFVEWEEVYKGTCYGTLRSEVERIWAKGHVIVFDVDVIGGINLKRIFGDKELAERLADDSHVVLSSANSINVGRLVPQVVYYFSAYAQLLERQVINVGDEVEFVVPTGNFGDILAGYYAKLLGLPVKHLVVASDKNNVLFDFLTSGTYNRQRPFFQTISPSMDILISSNLERMLYYMSDKDTRLISMLMNDLSQWGAYEVPEPMMKKIRSIFGTGWADENQVREMIADCWNKNHYVIDPHTACGYYVMQQMPRDPLTPRVLLSTASPYKFPRVVNESLGLDASGTDFECMDVLAKATGTTAPAALRGLETADVRFDNIVEIDGMEGFVEQAAKAL